MAHRMRMMLAATLALGVTVAGCSQGDAGKEQSAGDAKGSQPAEKAAPVHVPLMIRNTEGIDYDKLNKSEIFQKINELANVKFELVTSPKDDNEYSTKLKLAFASGDYPQVFASEGSMFKTDVPDLFESDVIVPLDDLLDKYGQNLKKMIPQEAWDTAKYNGKTYAIPAVQHYGAHTRAIFVRKDWLDNLGLTPPKTVDEFYNMLVAFRDKDPNKNGQKDEIPMAARKGFSWMPVEGIFGVGRTWVVENGEVIPAWASANNKKSLAFERKLYEEGLVFKEALTTDNAKDKIAAGLVGVYAHMPQDANVRAEQNMIAIPWFGAEGVEEFGYERNAVRKSYLITKSAKDPAGIVKFFDWMMSPEAQTIFNFGVEGRSHTVENGKIVYNEDKDPDKELSGSGQSAKWRPYFLKMVSAGAMTPEELNLFYGAQAGAMRTAMDIAEKAGVKNIVPDMPPVPIFEKRPDLAKFYPDFRIRFIIGESSLEDLDKLYADWKSRGGDEALKFVNDWYKKTK